VPAVECWVVPDFEAGVDAVFVFDFELGVGLGEAGAMPVFLIHDPGSVHTAGLGLPVRALAKAVTAIAAATAARARGLSNP
jgi:hypothetical protein